MSIETEGAWDRRSGRQNNLSLLIGAFALAAVVANDYNKSGLKLGDYLSARAKSFAASFSTAEPIRPAAQLRAPQAK